MKLLIISCCGKKLDRPAAAGELYQNREHNLVRAHQEELQAAGYQLAVLSAEYGLIAWDQVVEPYDRKMTERTAQHYSLRLMSQPWDQYEEVLVYGGKVYRDCIKRVTPATEIVGANRGNGDHFSALKGLIQREAHHASH
jgi:hypothetical protein